MEKSLGQPRSERMVTPKVLSGHFSHVFTQSQPLHSKGPENQEGNASLMTLRGQKEVAYRSIIEMSGDVRTNYHT